MIFSTRASGISISELATVIWQFKLAWQGNSCIGPVCISQILQQIPPNTAMWEQWLICYQRSPSLDPTVEISMSSTVRFAELKGTVLSFPLDIRLEAHIRSIVVSAVDESHKHSWLPHHDPPSCFVRVSAGNFDTETQVIRDNREPAFDRSLTM